MTLRTPPHEPPQQCKPHTPFQMALFAVAGAVLFYGGMIALPNPTSIERSEHASL